MPLHPIFVHFPLALVTVAFFVDLYGFIRRHEHALVVGWTCLLLGLIGMLLTVLSGVRDFYAADLNEATHLLALVHMRIGLVLGFVLFGLTIWRAWLAKYARGRRPVAFLMCFAVYLGLLTFQGWYGSELAYSHGAGVASTGQGMVPAADARVRLESTAESLRTVPGLNVSPASQPSPAAASDRP
jgi:uncharacterized membrane protein